MNTCLCHFKDDEFSGCSDGYAYHVLIGIDGSLSWEDGYPANLQGQMNVVIPILSDAFLGIPGGVPRLKKGLAAFSSQLGEGSVNFVMLLGLVRDTLPDGGQAFLAEMVDLPSVNLLIMCDQYINGVPARFKLAGSRKDLQFGLSILVQLLGKRHELFDSMRPPVEYYQQYGAIPATRSVGVRFLRESVQPARDATQCAFWAAGFSDILGLDSSGAGNRAVEDSEITAVLADLDAAVSSVLPRLAPPAFNSVPEWCIQTDAVVREEFRCEIDRCTSAFSRVRAALDVGSPVAVGSLFDGTVAADITHRRLREALLRENSTLQTADSFLAKLGRAGAQESDAASGIWQAGQHGPRELPQPDDLAPLAREFNEMMRQRPGLGIFYAALAGGVLLGGAAGWLFWTSSRLVLATGFSPLQWIGIGAGAGALFHILMWSFIVSPWQWLRERIFASKRKPFRAFLRRLSLVCLASAGGYAAWRMTGRLLYMPLYERMAVSIGISLSVAFASAIVGFVVAVRRWLRWKRECFDPLISRVETETRTVISAYFATANHVLSRLQAYVRARAYAALLPAVHAGQARCRRLQALLESLRDRALKRSAILWNQMEAPRGSRQLCEYATNQQELVRWRRQMDKLVRERVSGRPVWFKARDIIAKVASPVYLHHHGLLDELSTCIDVGFDAGLFDFGRPCVPPEGLPVREGFGVNTEFRRGAEATGTPLYFTVRNTGLAHDRCPPVSPANWGTQYEADGDFLMGWAYCDRWLPLSVWAEELGKSRAEFGTQA